jgi:phosphoenolpyruvate phosphomutase-like protein
VAAAVEATRRLGFPFMLTARAEGFLRGHTNLDDAIKRLQAYEKAGADVMMAPGHREASCSYSSPTSDATRAAEQPHGARGASLSRPGGNLTGVSIITADLNVKRIERLEQRFPPSFASPSSKISRP